MNWFGTEENKLGGPLHNLLFCMGSVLDRSAVALQGSSQGYLMGVKEIENQNSPGSQIR